MAKGFRLRKSRFKGETFTLVKERDEYNPRCNGCGVVIPVALWWKHSCSGADGEQSKDSSHPITTTPVENGGGKPS
jgi:hypothetical protein